MCRRGKGCRSESREVERWQLDEGCTGISPPPGDPLPKISAQTLGVADATASVPGAHSSTSDSAMECDESHDPLDILTGVAGRVGEGFSGCSVVEDAVGQKRKGGSKPGKHTCWALGCMVPASECKRIDKGRHADANFAAKQQNITFGTDRQGNERLVVPYTDYLCTDHMPVLPAKQILGAPVLIQTEAEGMLPAIVVEPAPLPTAGRGGQGRRTQNAQMLWLARADGGAEAHLTEADVWRLAELRRAYDVSLKKGVDAQKAAHRQLVDALRHKVAYSRDQPAEANEGEADEQPPAADGQPPRSPAPPLLQMCLRKRPERKAEVEEAKVPKVQAPVIKPLLYSDMAHANKTILGKDSCWLKSGACALKALSQPAAELYEYLNYQLKL